MHGVSAAAAAAAAAALLLLQVKRVAERLSDKKMKLELKEPAVDYLAREGYDPVYGARPVKRAVQRELETGLAKAMLRGEFEEEDTVIVDAGDKGLIFSRGPKVDMGMFERDGAFAAAR
jgi:ATP-dependent Clp protease ATP-binding subunit ClpB